MEASATASLRVISSAQATFRSHNPTYGNLVELKIADLIDPSISDGEKSGYIFTSGISEVLCSHTSRATLRRQL